MSNLREIDFVKLDVHLRVKSSNKRILLFTTSKKTSGSFFGELEENTFLKCTKHLPQLSLR